ncbi:MAG: SH3 domain-containing protein [Hungatella sp.]|nr:SH3 domain-containing protein [Hungatella sp.]
MKKKRIKQGLAVMLALFMTINSFSGSIPWTVFNSYADTRSAVVNATTLNVRSGPGTSYSVAGKLTNGTGITVVGETTGADRKVWYQIEYSGGKKGYVLSTYVKFPTAYSNDMNFENYLNSQGFPESYKPALRQLHAEYPNWVFKAQHTGLNWEEVISNESVVGRNLVHSSSDSSWKSTAEGAYDWNTSTWPGLDSSSYVAASDGIIRYYMDPRNFLDDKYVFQFLVHSYNASAQTADGLRSMVQNTFLSGSAGVSGTLNWNGSTGSGTGTGPGGGTSAGGASQVGPGVSSGSGNSSSGASQVGPGVSSGGGNSSGGASQVGPGVSSGSGNSSGGASLTGPGVSSGSGSASGGASLTGPGVSSGSGSTSGGVSLTAPGGTTSSNIVSGSGGVSLTAPGTTGGSTSGSGNVSLTAPGTSVSSNKYSNASISKKDTHRVTTALGPGLTTGPGGGSSSTSVPGSSSTTGPGAGSSSTTGPEAGSSGGPGQSSFPSGGGTSGTASYVDIIMSAGAQSGVNPYVLAAMIIQEQGSNGTGRCISGTVAGYVGYYNFFNIEAYQSGSMDAVSRGLWYASQSGSYGRPWDSVDKSILGGALYYGTNYVNAGQDTFYLKKFNVQGSNLYKHQYMTNVQGAASEGAKLSQAYNAQVKQSALEFKIPVYLNMPGTASELPSGNGSPNNRLSSLGVEGFSLTPTFSQDVTSYNLIVSPSVSSITVNAVPLASTTSVSGTGTIQLQNGNNEIMVSVRAQNGTVRNYVIHVVRQDNAPAYNSSIGPGGNGGGSGGPGTSTTEQSSYGPAYNSVLPGPGSSSSTGSGVSGGSNNTNMSGPGGSNVTIVR